MKNLVVLSILVLMSTKLLSQDITFFFQNLPDSSLLGLSKEERKKIVKEQIAQVAEDHKEVHDTEPEWHLVDRINMGLEARGYNYKISRYDL
jgi:hypothetical protein